MVTPTEPAAKLEHRGYNRGLILGLTMAESMLLLVFCLLLVAAAIVYAERQRATKANDALNTAQRTIEQLLKKLDAPTSQEDKEWRELVQAKELLQKYQKQELEPESIAELKSLAEALERSGMPRSTSELEARLKQLLAEEATQASTRPYWPPIISLSEANNNFFQSGSAELTPAFEDKLRGSIADQIATNLARYQANIIEVIGHTDEQPISKTVSTFDQTIIDVVDGRKAITSIVPADNAGLGMARAVAVANVLKNDPKLKDATVLPMSGAQLILPGDQLTVGQGGDVETRRRIEIRIRRRTEPTSP